MAIKAGVTRSVVETAIYDSFGSHIGRATHDYSTPRFRLEQIFVCCELCCKREGKNKTKNRENALHR